MTSIPLDFDKKSKVYIDSFMTTYYEWSEDKTEVRKMRMKKDGDLEDLGPFNLIPIYDLAGLKF